MAVVSPHLVVQRYWRPTVRWCRPHVGPALILLAVFALSIVLLFLPVNIKGLSHYGYVGVFLVTVLATGAMVLPVPYLGFIAIAGRDLDPLTVGLVAGLAAALVAGTSARVAGRGRGVVGSRSRGQSRDSDPLKP